MKEAFNFMFKDNMLKNKVIIYFLFLFLANLFNNYANIFAPACKGCLAPPQYYILYLIGTIIMLIPSGYGISCIKSFVVQSDNYILPFVNVKNNFVLGIKLGISVLIMAFILTIIATFAGILSVLISPLSTPIVLGVIGIIGVIIISFYSMAFSYIFATTESFLSYINFKKATNLIKNGIKHYIISCLLFFLITIVLGIFSSLLTLLAGVNFIGIAIISILISLISCYTVYVFAYITAKSIKEV